MATLDNLWSLLQDADRSGAPENCRGLKRVPFELDPEQYAFNYRQQIVKWYTPSESDSVEPFGDLDSVVHDLSLEKTHLKRHHVSCAAVQVEGADNSALSIWYRTPDNNRHWVALPGITYRTE